MQPPDTIVLIHGLWMTPRSWEEWVHYYEGKGYKVITPTYPGFEVEVEALREDPTPIAEATVPATVAHIAGQMRRHPTTRHSGCCTTTVSCAGRSHWSAKRPAIHSFAHR